MSSAVDLVVCGIAGSLRAGSFNRALLAAAAETAPTGMTVKIFDRVGEIPLFDEDLERRGDPEPVVALKAAIEGADALLFASPEYNRGMTGVLKNLIDWASRQPRHVLDGKPAAIVGATPGRLGTVNSQVMLRIVLAATGVRLMPKPEVMVGGAGAIFSEHRLTDERTLDRLRELTASLAEWTRRLKERGEE